MDPLRYLGPPSPFKEISQANRKEIKERISFIGSLTTHSHLHLSESEQEALDEYREACQTLIDLSESGVDNKEAHQAAIKQIQEYEKSMENGGPARLSFDITTKTKMGEELDNLYNVWTFSRYEKYLPDGVKKEAKLHPSSKVSDPWHKAFWKPFNGRLEAEADSFAKVMSGKNHHNECPTSLLLALLCERHNLDWDESVALIGSCARDDVEMLPKQDFVELLKARDVAAFATRLDRDEASLSLSTEYVMGVGTMLLAYFTTTLPETLFDTEEFPATKWTPKQALLDRFALSDGHEQSMRELFNRLFQEMVTGQDEEDEDDGEYDDYEDYEDFDEDEAAFSDESEDY